MADSFKFGTYIWLTCNVQIRVFTIKHFSIILFGLFHRPGNSCTESDKLLDFTYTIVPSTQLDSLRQRFSSDCNVKLEARISGSPDQRLIAQ